MDAPSGVGFNAAMDAIDTIITARQLPTASGSNKVPVWNGSSWVAQTVPPAGVTPGSIGQLLGTTLAGAVAWGGLQPVADSVLGSAAATMDFSSLPSTFAHLLLVFNGRGDTAAFGTTVSMRMNNDSTAVYDRGRIRYDGATTVAGAGAAAQTSMEVMSDMSAASASAGDSSTGIILIPNYTGTTFKKQVLALASCKTNDGANNNEIAIYSDTWLSTAAINRLTLLPGAGNFATGSRATIFGIG